MSLEEHIAEKRDAKATRVVLWLERANTTQRMCRRCWLHIVRDDDQRWADEAGNTDCSAPGFRVRALRVPHSPETWTVARVRGADPEERRSISAAAGLTRPCSETTWDRVVVLFKAREDALRGTPPGGVPVTGTRSRP